jgi:[protein-PII] uridylyltransferase
MPEGRARRRRRLRPRRAVPALRRRRAGPLPGDGDRAAGHAPATERFITDCWDAGLEIGSSVRTSTNAWRWRSDVTVQTALLEARFLVRRAQGVQRLPARDRQAMDAKAFLRAKTLEMRQRHQKYENTPYSLEPNCKESPGGLRDLQTVIWVARAAGLGRTWQQLAAHGLITPFEVRQLQRNEGVLKLIRARLHAIAGRREDRLVFDLQTAVAESFGYLPVARPARRPSG